MRRARPVMVCLFAIVVVVVCVQAEDDTPRDRGMVESVRSVLVEIPVTVAVKGEPVRGLTADDFVILDRGRRQQLVGFDVMDLTLTGAEATPSLDPQISIAARRRFLILFDMSFSDARTISRARDVVADWIQTALHPWDLVGVALYSSRNGARMILNFTSDRDQALLAVRTLGHPQFLERGSDPLAIQLGVPEAQRYASDDPSIASSPQNRYNQNIDDYEVMNALSFIYRGAYDPINRQGRRQYVTEMARSVSGMIHVMRHLGGRKHVVFLSEGIQDDLVFAVDASEEIKDLNEVRERGEIWNIDSTKRFGSTVAQGRLTEMIEAFRRADCSIHAIDTSTLDALGESRVMSTGGSQSLFYLANETGGELYRNFTDLGSAMSTLMNKTSVTYLLTFSPDRIEADGEYHKIKVKLRAKVPGAQLSYRPGYFAPDPDARLTPDELRMQAATKVMGGMDGGTLGTSVLATPFRAGADLAYVPVLIEIDGASLPDLDGDDPVSLEIYTYAVRSDGAIGDFFTQQLNIDPNVVGDRIRRSGIKYYGDLELPPGSYSIRVLVREQSRGLYSSRSVPLDVPEFEDDEMHLLPPMFPDAKGAWLLARDNGPQSAEASSHPFPFMAGEEPFVPAARPVVDAHDPSRVCIVAYDAQDGPVSVEASLVDSSGDVLLQPQVNVWEQLDDAADGKNVYMASFEPGGIEAGQYVLSVKMTNQATGRTDSSSIPVLVVERSRATESATAPPASGNQTDGTTWSRTGFPAPRR